MAAEIVGTAYVRIRAITAGLAKDISDGVDRGVKDAGPDIDKAGESIGDGLSSGAGKKFRANMADEVGDALNSPDINKKSEDGGENISRRVRKGVDKENKKNDPFKSLLTSFKKMSDALPGLGGPKLWAAVFSPNIVGALMPFISSAIAGVTAALGTLVTAAAGAGVAMAGIAAVALPGLGLIFAAFKAETEELKHFKEGVKQALEPWKEVARVTQRQMLPGIELMVRAMGKLVPLFSDFGEDIGKIVGDLAQYAGAILTSAENQDRLKLILSDSTSFFTEMQAAALAFVDMFLPFLEAVSPLGVQFAESLRAMADNLNAFVQARSGTGELAADFQLWYDRLSQVANILGNTFIALWNILSIGADVADPALDSIETLTGKWREFTSSVEGQAAIRNWYNEAQPLLHEVWLLIQDIGRIFGEGFALGGGTEGATEFVRTIRTDWLPILERLSEALKGKGLGDALKRLADAFVGLIEQMGGAGTLSSTVSTFALALETLARIMENPAVQAIVPYLVAFGGAMKVLGFLVGPMIGVIETIDRLQKIQWAAMATSIGTFAVVLISLAAAVAVVWAVWHFWDEIVASLQVAWEWFTALNTPLKILIGTLAGFVAIVLGPILLLPAALLGVVAAIKNWGAIVEFVQGAYDVLVRFVTGLPDRLRELPGLLLGALGSIGEALGGFFTSLPEQLGGIASSLGETFANIGTSIKEGLLGFLENLPNLILDALGALGSIGLNIIGLIADGLQEALPRLGQFFVELPTKILGFIGDVAGTLIPIGASIIASILQGLVGAIPEILTFFLQLPFEIGTILRRAIVELVKFGIEMVAALTRGIVSAAPRVFQWFKDLPGNLLRSAIAVASWLLETGKLVIQGLITGFQNSLPAVLSWFRDLPGMILGALSALGGFLVDLGARALRGIQEGASQVWGSVAEFFGTLPGQIVSAIGDLFGLIWTGISSGIAAFYTNIDNWILGIIDFFITLPERVITAIGDLGGAIWGFISGGFATTAASIATWIAERLTDFGNFVIDLPGKFLDFGANLIVNIASGMADAIPKIATWISERLTDFGNFVADVPDKFLDFGTNLMRNLATGLAQGATAVKTWVDDRLDDIKNFVLDIPDKLWNLGSTLASSIKDVLKRAWNSAVDLLPSIPGFHIPGTPIDIPGFDPSNFLKMQQGGIIPGSSLGTPLIAGENFGAEAIVPMTRPSRALAVMQEAGLDRLVLDAYFKGQVPGQTGTAGEVTMLRIDRAVMTAPVDADLIVQKLTAAYTRLAS
jgi:hypothetical protein